MKTKKKEKRKENVTIIFCHLYERKRHLTLKRKGWVKDTILK